MNTIEVSTKIGPREINICIDTPEFEMSTKMPPREETNTTDIAEPSPSLEEPPDSLQKSNAKKKNPDRFGICD